MGRKQNRRQKFGQMRARLRYFKSAREKVKNISVQIGFIKYCTVCVLFEFEALTVADMLPAVSNWVGCCWRLGICPFDAAFYHFLSHHIIVLKKAPSGLFFIVDNMCMYCIVMYNKQWLALQRYNNMWYTRSTGFVQCWFDWCADFNSLTFDLRSFLKSYNNDNHCHCHVQYSSTTINCTRVLYGKQMRACCCTVLVQPCGLFGAWEFITENGAFGAESSWTLDKHKFADSHCHASMGQLVRKQCHTSIVVVDAYSSTVQ